MRRVLFFMFIFLLLINVANVWAFDPKDFGMAGFEDAEEKIKNSFIGISGGYHRPSFTSYNDNIGELNEVLGPYGYEMNKLEGDILDGKISLGYRMRNHALVFGIGYFDKIKADSQWSDGAKGETSISTYFVDLTYRYYLRRISEEETDYSVGTLVPYLGGGAGWYFASWKFYDPYLSWVDLDTGELNNELTGKGNNFGFHIVGGMDFFIAKKFSLNLQIDYTYAIIREVTAKIEKEGDVITEWIVYFGDEKLELDLSGMSILFGINYHF